VVTRALLVLAIVASSARAQPIVDDDKTTWNLLGTRIMFGSFEAGDTTMATFSIAVSIDRPLVGKWRVLGEYEYLWVGPADFDKQQDLGVASLGNAGHRVNAGIRHRFEEYFREHDHIGFFVDAEVGGGAMKIDHPPTDWPVEPHIFFGLRGGGSIVWDKQMLDYELVFRGLATRDGPGFMAGIGLVWGN
jgi:hypothetical protein